MRQPGLWRARMAAGLTGMALVAGLVAAAPARAAGADESRLLTLANQLRASVGAPPLAVDESLSAIARTWAAAMAAAGTISHNSALTTQVTGWRKLAENVGMGPDIDTVHQALVASHSHYVNLTDTEVTVVGIGVVTAGQYVFVVEDFLLRTGAAPASPTTAPPPRPAATSTTTSTTVAAAPAPPPPAPAAAASPEPSPWLAMALELTRSWERASG